MNSSNPNRKMRTLGVLSLAMITAVSVDSIRNLPTTALFGSSLIFYFLLAALFFLLPSALVSAELASNSQQEGGVYSWIKNAFGAQAGFIAIWFQWIENVIWYPAILSFVAGTIGYLIAPSLATSKTFLVTVILCSFWGATIINLLGIKVSAKFSNFAAVVGLILPISLIITAGVTWIVMGKPIQIHFTHASLLPNFGNSDMWVALTGIILSFCGMEIAAVHSSNVKNPKRSYPRAMFLATGLIMLTLLCGSLAIAAVIPEQQISLVAGIMQAFNTFFSAYHMHWILPVLALMLVIGGLGGVNSWIIAPTRGLLYAAQEGHLPRHFCRENRHGAPRNILVYQALIVTVITMAFLLMPSVNGSYWLLTVLAAQLYMIMYAMMFAAAIRLRKSRKLVSDGFRIGGGRVGIWIVAGAGFIGSLVTFFIGFIPPANIQVGGSGHYETLLLMGLITLILPPFILYRFSHKRRAQVIASTVALAER